MNQRMIVLGGGLAGISAALELADRGHEVTVLEARPRLGGATYSFQRNGMNVDTGQHVFLRCYRHYRELLDRLGVGELVTVQPRLDIPVLRAGRPPARLRRSNLRPAPMHLLAALAGYRELTPTERVRAMLAAAALRRVDPDDPARDDTTFGDWLCRHGQSPAAIERLWALLTVAALNLEPGEASLALAARVFRTGLLDDVAAGDVGIPEVPLAALHDRPARELFTRLGIHLHTGERARAIEPTGDGFTVRTDADELHGDGVVVAVPHTEAERLVPPGATPAPRRWRELGASPIVNVHVHFDRKVMDWSFAAVLDPDVGWLFDRSAAAGVTHGQYIVASISAADAQVGVPAEQVKRANAEAVARVLPAARHAEVIDAFVTREPRATFRQRAGSARYRPPAHTNWPNLVLAGAWTATGWPDTMEGAVLSGLTAADALIHTAPRRAHREEVTA